MTFLCIFEGFNFHIVTTTNLKELQKEVLKELKAIGAETRRVCDLRYTLFIDCLYIKLFQECPINRFKSSKY